MPFESRKSLNPLGIALTRLLEARGLTDAAFARKAGISKGLLSQLKRRPPTKLPKKVDIKKWAGLLGLGSHEVEALFEAAELAHSPGRIQALVTELQKRKR